MIAKEPHQNNSKLSPRRCFRRKHKQTELVRQLGQEACLDLPRLLKGARQSIKLANVSIFHRAGVRRVAAMWMTVILSRYMTSKPAVSA